MTKQEVLDALEALKEMTNDSGKQALDAIKAGVVRLCECGPEDTVAAQDDAWKPEPEEEKGPERQRHPELKAKPKKASPKKKPSRWNAR